MYLALLVTSRNGPSYNFIQHWSSTIKGLGIKSSFVVGTDGSDLQIARSLTAKQAYDTGTYTHFLWLDDDVMAPQNPQFILDQLQIADAVNVPVSGSFVRRGITEEIIGMNRDGQIRTCKVGENHHKLIPSYTGFGCLALSKEAFVTQYDNSIILKSGARMICCPYVKDGVYYSEDFAYAAAFDMSYRVETIGYGHYAKNILTYP